MVSFNAQMELTSRLRITIVMAVAFTAEHTDSMILSAMYLAIGRPLAEQLQKHSGGEGLLY